MRKCLLKDEEEDGCLLRRVTVFFSHPKLPMINTWYAMHKFHHQHKSSYVEAVSSDAP